MQNIKIKPRKDKCRYEKISCHYEKEVVEEYARTILKILKYVQVDK